MKPHPEDPSEFEVPLTRAAFSTSSELADEKTHRDHDRTLNEGPTDPTLAVTDPNLTRVPESGLGPTSFTDWSDASPFRETANSRGSSNTRGIVGKIESGQTLYGKYHVLNKLGGGAMGDVWLVRHATLKSQHALKVIVPNFARNAVALMRFQREFEVMATLRHEHAVIIFDASIDDEGGYIDMEFVDGLTLDAVLAIARTRPDRDLSSPLMPLDWIVRVLEQLTDVLQVAHDKNIVHRDLKPSNMMVLSGRKPGKEYLKVLDFGIAKIRDDPDGASGRELEESSNKTEGFIGTPSYGSPEQAMAREDVDGRADLYSVGVMLYEFVTGRLPFRGSPLQVMSQHTSHHPPAFYEANPRLRSIPEVEHAILRILSKDREHRPQSARELFEEFQGAVAAAAPFASHGLTPPTWEAMPFYDPPTSGRVTDPESQVGDLSLPSTIEATLIDSRVHPEPAKPVSFEASIDLGPSILDKSGLPWNWKWVSAAIGLVLGSLVVIGLIIMGRSIPSKNVSKARSEPETARFQDFWPPNFVPVDDSNRDLAWPEQVRQTPDDRRFNRFADGVYLPDGSSVEDPKDLVKGWPRVITRDEMRFIRIEEGAEWSIGAWDALPDQKRSDVPSHPVKLSGYYIQETEVTNGQFEDYLIKHQLVRPIEWERVYFDLKKKLGDEARNHPAVNLSRKQALAFAFAFDAQLPTEAQWEYAARSRGIKRRYVWGETPPPSRLQANIEPWDDKTTAPVMSYPQDKTSQGVYDMLGNVREICLDAFGAYKSTPLAEVDPCENPVDSLSTAFVVRGASFGSLPEECILTRRDKKVAETEFAEDIGFRLVIVCPKPRMPR